MPLTQTRYTAQDPSDTASSILPSSTNTTIPNLPQSSSLNSSKNPSIASNDPNPHPHNTLSLILGVSLGTTVLIFIIISIILIQRHKRKSSPYYYYPPNQAIQRQESDGVYPISLNGSVGTPGGRPGILDDGGRDSSYIIEPLTISDPSGTSPWPLYTPSPPLQGYDSKSTTTYIPPSAMHHPYASTSSGRSGSNPRLSNAGTTEFGGREQRPSMYSSYGSTSGRSDNTGYFPVRRSLF